MQVDPRTQNASSELLKMLFPEFGRMPQLPGLPSQNQGPQLPPENTGGVVVDNYGPTVTDQQQQELLMNDPRIAQLLAAEGQGSSPLMQDAPVNVPQMPSLDEMFQSGQAGIDRRGMFGVKGDFRDVLGVLGDALLMGFGKQDPIYAPRRNEERLADTLALEKGEVGRLAREGYGSLAMKQRQQGIENALAAAKAKSEASARAAAAEADRQKVFMGHMGTVAGILRGGKTPETKARVAQMARDLLKEKGVTLPESFAIKDDFSDEYLSALENMLIDPEAFARLQEQTSYHDALIAESGAKRASLDADREADNEREDRELVVDTLLQGGALRVKGKQVGDQIRRNNQPIHIRNAEAVSSGPKGTAYKYKGKWLDASGKEIK